jgi:hypothetical protein
MNHLHIVSFDIPHPPIYGGIIEVFYKLKALRELGYEITLHCFDYKGTERSDMLESLCREVHYYPRKKAYQVFFNLMPYIVSSRSNNDLLSNLLLDESPILFEGLHTCFYLGHPSLANRNKVVCMHNIEWDYYQNLSKADQNFIHKIHFNIESKKLKQYESVLKYAQSIFCINKNDAEYMKQYCEQSIFVTPFHQNEKVQIKEGIGDYILYHGSLDVVENHQAATWLIMQVFSKIDKKVIIAGKKPKSSLVDLIKKYPNIELRKDVSKEALNDLIENAQCHVLTTFQGTGLKLKLLNTLYRGREVIVNNLMVANSNLESLCTIANTPEEIIEAIDSIWMKEFSDEAKLKRKNYLNETYSNENNAKLMIPYIFRN